MERGPSQKFEIGSNKVGFRPNSVPVEEADGSIWKKAQIKTKLEIHQKNTKFWLMESPDDNEGEAPGPNPHVCTFY